jgi:hypothetical protein
MRVAFARCSGLVAQATLTAARHAARAIKYDNTQPSANFRVLLGWSHQEARHSILNNIFGLVLGDEIEREVLQEAVMLGSVVSNNHVVSG